MNKIATRRRFRPATQRGAALILTRAGGTLTDDHGASWLFSKGGYIASNNIVHGWTHRCLQQVFEARRSRP